MKLREKKLNMGMGRREVDFPSVNCVLFCEESFLKALFRNPHQLRSNQLYETEYWVTYCEE